MHPWINPFSNNRAKFAWQSRPADISDDDDSCADQVVYHEDHLQNLFGLYNRPTKDQERGPSQPVLLEADKVVAREKLLPALPSAQETVVWHALEGSDLYIQEATQFTQYGTEADWSTGAPETDAEGLCDVLEGGLPENLEISLQSSAAAQQPGTRYVGVSNDVTEKNVEPRDYWDDVVQENEELGDTLDCNPFVSATRTRNYSKGMYKKKLRFNFRSSRACDMQELSDENQKIPLAQQLQRLSESDDFHFPRVNSQNRSHTSVPIAKQLLELVQQDSYGRPSKKAETINGHPIVMNSHKRLVNEEICEDGDNIVDSDKRDSDAAVAIPLDVKLPTENLHDRFQKALLAAPTRTEDFHRHGRLNGSVFGFAARLQKVVEQERIDRAHFMKMLQMGHNFQDHTDHVEVQIVEKNLEARLAACICKVVKAPKHWVGQETGTSGVSHPMVMVLFNMQTNAYLDLEVGCAVRIHPPWQELLNTTNSLKTILCTYFCEILDTA